jgi:hypothetical protein
VDPGSPLADPLVPHQPFVEEQRQQERERALRKHNERGADARLGDETPCFSTFEEFQKFGFDIQKSSAQNGLRLY